jgi:acyl-coenzyme A thioesterase PaaI-like protein
VSDDLFELGRDILARQSFSALLGTTTVVSSGRTQAVCHCEVTAIDGDNERIVAVAQGTIIRVKNPAG